MHYNQFLYLYGNYGLTRLLSSFLSSTSVIIVNIPDFLFIFYSVAILFLLLMIRPRPLLSSTPDSVGIFVSHLLHSSPQQLIQLLLLYYSTAFRYTYLHIPIESK